MIEITTNEQDNIIAAHAHGTVTREDYEKGFIAAVDAKLKKHDKVRLLYQLGSDFAGYTLAAILDDVKFGVEYITAFEKIAIVTDVTWVGEASRFFGMFIPCPVRIFANSDLAGAKAWLDGGK